MLKVFFYCYYFMWIQLYQQNFYALLFYKQLKVNIGLRQRPSENNQIFTCNCAVSSYCLSITLAIKYNLLLLFPTSPLEVAASFRSTIPMVIAASVLPLSRKAADVWIPQKATKVHLWTTAFKFTKQKKVFTCNNWISQSVLCWYTHLAKMAKCGKNV